MPLALILPLIPTLVEFLTKIIDAALADKQATPEQKAALNELAARLDDTAAAVQALEVREV